jgi:hypothetical protein
VDGVSLGVVDTWVFEDIGSDHQIEAWFAINAYTITAIAGEGGTISPTGELVLEHGDSQAYAITAELGYHIADVVVDGISQGVVNLWVFEDIDSDHQIEALFAVNTYTLTAIAGAGGTISPTGELVVEHGNSQVYSITADVGYHITDVIVDGVSQGVLDTWVFEDIGSDHQIEAWFANNTYTITAIAGDGGTISPTGALVVAHGDSQAYTILEDEGYHIVDVVVDGVSLGVVDTWVFEDIGSDHQIEAWFAINTYTITATAGEGGTISPTGELVLEHGDSQAYAITADVGHHITDVEVDGISQGVIDAWVFEGVSSDHQIEAWFAINTYTITATASEGGSISPTGVLVVKHGDSQAYSIMADVGFQIADIIIDGVSKGPVDEWVFEGVESSHAIYAVFERLYVVAFYVDMQYAEDFNPETDSIFLLGSMFDWSRDGALVQEKDPLYDEPQRVYRYISEFPEGTYEYLYYLNTYPAGSELPSAPYRTFTVPDTLELFDFFGYRTDPTTVPETTKKIAINVYPNPARERIVIESSLVINELRVYDVYGRIMVSATSLESMYELNVNGWPNGIYFIRAELQGKIFTHSVVLKH